jgi:hypothetical protein
MKRFLILALAAFLALSSFAAVSYNLNGGVTNDYGWMDKNDMFQACMVDMGVVGDVDPLIELQSSYDPFTMICGSIPDVTGFLFEDSWEWLEHYILAVQDNDPDAYKLKEGDPENKGWKYAIAAFFLERQKISDPRTADFSQAGKIDAFQSAWKHGFDNPTNPTGEWVLNAPYKEGSTFLGWYSTSDFSGNKVTSVSPSFSGTLYAKWIDDEDIQNTIEQQASLCAEGDSYYWEIDQQIYTQPGTYYAFVGNTRYILHLVLSEPIYSTVSEYNCEAYVLDGDSCTESGQYTFIFTASNGCDSIVLLDLVIYDQSLPATVSMPVVKVGEPVDVTDAQADINTHINTTPNYAPNAVVSWFIKQAGEWQTLTADPIAADASVVTLKYEVQTDCRVVSSDDIVVPIVTTDLLYDQVRSQRCKKCLINGQLIIRHSEKIYNAQGVQL